MIGLVLVTHRRLTEEFAAVLEHVVGPQDQIAAISTRPEDDMELRRRDLYEKIDLIDEGDDTRAGNYGTSGCRPHCYAA
jgi:PTS system mannose-specific IIA component